MVDVVRRRRRAEQPAATVPAVGAAAPAVVAAALRQEIADAADALNLEIQAAEAALVALRLAVRAEVYLRATDHPYAHDKLALGKYQGSWRLLCVYQGEEPREELLVSASKVDRLAAVGLFPLLLAELVERAKAECDALRAAAEEAAEFVRALRGAPPITVDSPATTPDRRPADETGE